MPHDDPDHAPVTMQTSRRRKSVEAARKSPDVADPPQPLAPGMHPTHDPRASGASRCYSPWREWSMKLVRFGPRGREKPGIVDAKGRIRDLSKVVPDIAGEALSPKSLANIRKTPIEKLPLVKGNPRLGACVGKVGNFIAIGLNYSDHAAEAGMPIPKEPIIFNKVTTCICGPNDDTMVPKDSTKLDWEVELGIVIGQRARYLAKDEVKDPQGLAMWLDVNGEKRQRGNTRTMIFDCKHLVWYCSQFFVLEPGDVIITGTPPGVGLGMKPEPKFLKAGDIVTLGIDGLGEQRQKVVKFKK